MKYVETLIPIYDLTDDEIQAWIQETHCYINEALELEDTGLLGVHKQDLAKLEAEWNIRHPEELVELVEMEFEYL